MTQNELIKRLQPLSYRDFEAKLTQSGFSIIEKRTNGISEWFFVNQTKTLVLQCQSVFAEIGDRTIHLKCLVGKGFGFGVDFADSLYLLNARGVWVCQTQVKKQRLKVA